MKTVLITGGAGLIGSNAVRLFMQTTDARIVNVDKLTYAGNPDSFDWQAGLDRMLAALQAQPKGQAS